MDKITNITAISGWALPRRWFAEEVTAAFPGSQVNVIYPETPSKLEEAKILLRRYPADLYIGYSLGSLWLLKYKHLLPDYSIKALLAPILSFLNKDEMGGTTSETQLNYLSRGLKRSPDSWTALSSFFISCDLPFPQNRIEEIPDKKILLEGLHFLKTCRANGEDTKIFLSILGENDIFIDGKQLRRHIPHLDIIQGVGHAPGKLLNRLADRLDWETHNP